MAKHRRGATCDQLRNDIDSGRSGDKVRFRDPATAPLGTDEEAAGTPVDPHVVAETRRRERRMQPPTDARRSATGEWSGVLLWIGMVLGVAAGIAAGLWLS
jgi:hypothetical protein